MLFVLLYSLAFVPCFCPRQNISDDAAVGAREGFYCPVCDVSLKDSQAYLSHINGRSRKWLRAAISATYNSLSWIAISLSFVSDQKRTGHSLFVEHSKVEDVKRRMELVKQKMKAEREAQGKPKGDDHQAAFKRRIKELEEEEEARKRRKKEEKKLKKKGIVVNGKKKSLSELEEEQPAKVEAAKEEAEEEDDGIDPEMAAALGFSGFK